MAEVINAQLQSFERYRRSVNMEPRGLRHIGRTEFEKLEYAASQFRNFSFRRGNGLFYNAHTGDTSVEQPTTRGPTDRCYASYTIRGRCPWGHVLPNQILITTPLR